ncbi:hypothetical protein BT96DRAFT_174862 [Gymnopus androsaceus JB14]|uniref:CHAT domain-containing protein n=1 Tax=Gymnopus androsaceus JB14 TaxID=1447944 RepID=A0A6A4IAM2_9AGAR|nr:hypothetical protein BT96DRAFT_174862 [Gymnopus androsaceus JB14]
MPKLVITELFNKIGKEVYGYFRTEYPRPERGVDVDTIIRECREHMVYTWNDPERRASLSSRLGDALWIKFTQTGKRKDLDLSVQYLREALNLRGKGHAQHGNALMLLGICLLTLYDEVGIVAHLDESIQRCRDGAAACPSEPTWLLPTHLYTLATALITRYRRLLQTTDLDSAIDSLRKIIAMPASKLAYTGSSMPRALLSTALIERYRMSQDIQVLDEGIALFRAALQLHKQKFPDESVILDGLAVALRLRFISSGEEIHLRSALDYHFAVLSRKGVRENPRRFSYLVNFSETLRLRYELTRCPEEVHIAASLLREGSPPSTHPVYSSILTSLSQWALLVQNPSEFVQAIQHAIEATQQHNAPARERLQSSRDTLQIAEGNGIPDSIVCRQALLHLYRNAVDLLVQIAGFELDATSQLSQLVIAGDLVNRGASRALDVSQPIVAIEMLEAGRAVMWAQALRLRTGFDHIGQVNPLLQKQLVEVSEELKSSQNMGSVGDLRRPSLEGFQSISSGPDFAHEHHAAQRRQKAAEFEMLLQRARALKGFSRFMLGDDFERLAFAARNGPVVILLEMHAIIIQTAISQPVVINFSMAAIVPLHTDFKAYSFRSEHQFFSRDANGNAQERLGLRKKQDALPSFTTLLHDLWLKIVKPILQALDITKPSSPEHRRRLWWCTTGGLSFMPFHAAGIYDQDSALNECCYDYVISSYTPTLKALLEAQRGVSNFSVSRSNVLAIAVPEAENCLPLPDTTAEVAKVTTVVSPDRMIPHDGTVADVLNKLQSATIVHLACHGRQNANNALLSGFVLKDGTLDMLAIRDMFRNSTNNDSFLAILSACHSAAIDQKQPDETLSLAASMMFAGYRSVIATMWTMEDSHGPPLMEVIYEELFRSDSFGSEGPAYALAVAIDRLRSNNVSPRSWATFVHYGV